MAKQTKQEVWDFDLMALTEPYLLPFENDELRLTQAVIDKHSSHRQNNRRYVLTGTKELAFEDGILKLLVSIRGDSDELLWLKVAPEALWIWCSKTDDNNSLSKHAYFGLTNIALGGYKCFKPYYWPDFFGQKTQFLDIVNISSGFAIAGKPQFGQLYRPGLPLLNNLEFSLSGFSLPESIQSQLSGETVIGYALEHMSLRSYHSRHYPFLVPFCGKKSKDGSSVVSFDNYLLQSKNDTTLVYSTDQEVLNAYSSRMQEIALLIRYEGDKLVAESKEEHYARKQQLFTYWKTVLPYLIRQPFVYHHYSYGMRNIKGKPRKLEMIACRYTTDVPKLCFYLHDKGDYLQLRLQVKINNKPIALSKEHIPFFIMDQQYTLYMISSLLDEELLDLFYHADYKLTVLKSHLNDFFQSYLVHLSHLYPMTLISPSKFSNKSALNRQMILCQQPVLHLTQTEELLILEPCMEYEDGTECNVLQDGTLFFSREDDTILVSKRNRLIEEAYKRLILSLHSDFINQIHKSFLFLPKHILKTNWLKHRLTILENHNVKIYGLNGSAF